MRVCTHPCSQGGAQLVSARAAVPWHKKARVADGKKEGSAGCLCVGVVLRWSRAERGLVFEPQARRARATAVDGVRRGEGTSKRVLTVVGAGGACRDGACAAAPVANWSSSPIQFDAKQTGTHAGRSPYGRAWSPARSRAENKTRGCKSAARCATCEHAAQYAPRRARRPARGRKGSGGGVWVVRVFQERDSGVARRANPRAQVRGRHKVEQRKTETDGGTQGWG
jgi:hypothetical protein